MKYKVSSWILVVVFLGAPLTMPVAAAPSPDRSLGISPLRSELTISPGTSFDGKLTLTNSGKETLSIALTAEIFSVTNEAYDYSFDPAGTGVDWVSFSTDSVSIDPSKSAMVNYKVSVPINAEAGGRYLSLFASSSPQAAASGVTSINRVASLLYVTIAGDQTRTGNVLSFDSPILTFGNPTWSATVQNSGSTHFHSIYGVQLRSLFGGTVLKTTTNDSLILPSSVRLVSQSLPTPDILGVYRLDYTISLGDVPAKQETRWILYLPPIQTLLVLGVIIAIIVLWPKRKKKVLLKTED